MKRSKLHFPPVLSLLRRAFVAFANWRRRRFKHLDTITLILPSTLPPLPESRGWLRQRLQGPPALSLLDLERMFQRIEHDPRPKGVILHLRGLAMPLADLQTLRGMILRLHAGGKRVTCYAQGYGLGQYYVASACDDLILQPGGSLDTIGLREQAVFLKDALASVGVSLDVIAISPYKGAYDQFSRADISPEGRAQLEWLLDSRYDILLSGIAEGRGWTLDQTRAFIDGAPYLDTQALAQGYVDAVLNEEGLPGYLKSKHLLLWDEARRRLFIQARKRARKVVMLLPINGLMVPGESRADSGRLPVPIPFLGGARAGDLTVVRQVRSLMKRDRVAAVILFVDSPGGVGIAAEAMTAALDELAKTRPVVVYMNAVAASGGYYVATAGQHIVAQPGTITGSIGVVLAKPVMGGLYERLNAHAVEFTRGANVDIYSEQTPFSEAQRQQMYASIVHFYEQFVAKVARSRHMTEAEVHEVAAGRVWTGAQALQHGLIDEVGDLRAALVKARALANLPDDAPLVIFGGKTKPLPPQLAETTIPAAFGVVWENARALFNSRAQLVMSFWWESKW